jgi:hypothetical protein
MDFVSVKITDPKHIIMYLNLTLHSLKQNGSAIFHFQTGILSRIALDALYILYASFNCITVLSSKIADPIERYVVCKEFKGTRFQIPYPKQPTNGSESGHHVLVSLFNKEKTSELPGYNDLVDHIESLNLR